MLLGCSWLHHMHTIPTTLYYYVEFLYEDQVSFLFSDLDALSHYPSTPSTTGKDECSLIPSLAPPNFELVWFVVTPLLIATPSLVSYPPMLALAPTAYHQTLPFKDAPSQPLITSSLPSTLLNVVTILDKGKAIVQDQDRSSSINALPFINSVEQHLIKDEMVFNISFDLMSPSDYHHVGPNIMSTRVLAYDALLCFVGQCSLVISGL